MPSSAASASSHSAAGLGWIRALVARRLLSSVLQVDDQNDDHPALQLDLSLLPTTHHGAAVTVKYATLRPISFRPNDDDDSTVTLTGQAYRVTLQWQWGRGGGGGGNTSSTNTATTATTRETAHGGASEKAAPQNDDDANHQRKDGSDWMHNVRLVVDGLQLTIALTHDQTSTAPTPKKSVSSSSSSPVRDTSTTTTTTSTSPKPPPKSFFQSIKDRCTVYVAEQVERILDTIEVSITDFDIQIQFPSSGPAKSTENDDDIRRTLVLGGARLHLAPSMEDATDPTRRRRRHQLAITNLFSHIRRSDPHDNLAATTVFALLQPVSYQVEGLRSTDQPFYVDFPHRWEWHGQSTDGGICVCTGIEQMAFLNYLVGLFMGEESSSSSSHGKATTSMSDGTTATRKHSESSNTDKPNTTSSFLRLPLTALSLVLPNDTKISVAGLLLQYRLDGSILTIRGDKAISIDNLDVLSVGSSGAWQADLVKSHLSIGSTDENGMQSVVTSIHARQEEIQKVNEGLQRLLEFVQMIGANQSGAVAKLIAAKPSSDARPADASLSSSAWSISVSDEVHFQLDGPNGQTEFQGVLRGINASMDAQTVTVDSLQQFNVPGTIRLSKPLEKLVVCFDGSVLEVRLMDVVATLNEPPESQKRDHEAEKQEWKELANADSSTLPPDGGGKSNNSVEVEDIPAIVLPFGAKAEVRSVTIYETDGETLHTTVANFRAAIGPHVAENDNTDHGQRPKGGVRILAMLDSVSHDMISMVEPKVMGIVYPPSFSRVDQFRFGAKTVSVAAGYSVLDWIRLFETGDQNRRKEKKAQSSSSSKKEKENNLMDLCMPLALVHPLKVRLSVRGELLGTKGTTINIDQFQGNPHTVLRDLVKFYSHRAASSMPGMFKDADVLGLNLTDTAAGTMGPAGVVLLAGVDGLKYTIDAGKRNRGAEEDDQMMWGDFFRGLGQLATEATRKGAAQRGKRPEDHLDPLDWALGATTDVVQYTNDNKARLGGAGAGALGLTMGLFLGGPVGAYVGAVVATAATTKTINVIDSKIAKNVVHREQAKRIKAEHRKTASDMSKDT